MPDVLDAEGLAGHGLGEGGPEGFEAVLLEKAVELLDLAGPGAWPAVGDLGEVVERLAAHLEQVLAHEVALAALARDLSHGLGAVLGPRGLGAALERRGWLALKRPATILTRSW